MSKIKAYRGGQEREFTQRVWDAMGTGHCGWTAAPEVPKEVAEAKLAPASPIVITGKFENTEQATAPKTRKRKSK